ncbi:MAG: NUDIX hydrolase [Ruminococcaceae bacterium]|nr:NUDIX hydrolase [Oscillospiraceae bacterium]
MKVTDCIEAYFELMRNRPELFSPSDIYPIVTDKKTLEDYTQATNKPLGVVYQSDYHIVVVDLIENDDGSYYTYERTIPDKTGRGVVCVPEYEGKYILLRQYRHPIRGVQLGFPRGFGENGLTSTQNAKKELSEELEANVSDARKIGEITPDSGFLGGIVDILHCTVTSYNPNSRNEGVLETLLCTYEELSQMIKDGIITDSFTICGFSML